VRRSDLALWHPLVHGRVFPILAEFFDGSRGLHWAASADDDVGPIRAGAVLYCPPLVRATYTWVPCICPGRSPHSCSNGPTLPSLSFPIPNAPLLRLSPHFSFGPTLCRCFSFGGSPEPRHHPGSDNLSTGPPSSVSHLDHRLCFLAALRLRTGNANLVRCRARLFSSAVLLSDSECHLLPGMHNRPHSAPWDHQETGVDILRHLPLPSNRQFSRSRLGAGYCPERHQLDDLPHNRRCASCNYCSRSPILALRGTALKSPCTTSGRCPKHTVGRKAAQLMSEVCGGVFCCRARAAIKVRECMRHFTTSEFFPHFIRRDGLMSMPGLAELERAVIRKPTQATMEVSGTARRSRERGRCWQGKRYL